MEKKVKFQNLRMIALEKDGNYSLDISVASGFAEFYVVVPLNKLDFEVIASDERRATLLQAAMHHPFQLRDTALSENEQRKYLDVILHAPEPEVENFLTELDHGSANGAISNMVRITAKSEYQSLRNGNWFNSNVPKT
ncbi:hypothetical protein [Vibrio metoecus]|uniref:Uncharacterized protein n=1 Tax=Vibrio metoecus TaxID=1481663 RepID=A0A271VND4_VIBMT|nr:hypothetical protein [Vibrio metoecus]KQB06576.1 hypothetical protein XV94_17430 [Vibrio metoecus]PAR19075.1 hypothetical protein CGU03_17590 [Vibrio metoecus]PAR20366.1 hypothetical protein CGU02_18100 [Vibrio metoecus]